MAPNAVALQNETSFTGDEPQMQFVQKEDFWNTPPYSSSAVLEPKQLTFGNISWKGALHKSSLSKAKVIHAFNFTSLLAKKKKK